MRTLTLHLTNGVLSVEHRIDLEGPADDRSLPAIEDAIDELSYKLSVCEQALTPIGTFKEIPDPNPNSQTKVLHHFEKWRGPRR